MRNIIYKQKSATLELEERKKMEVPCPSIARMFHTKVRRELNDSTGIEREYGLTYTTTCQNTSATDFMPMETAFCIRRMPSSFQGYDRRNVSLNLLESIRCYVVHLFMPKISEVLRILEGGEANDSKIVFCSSLPSINDCPQDISIKIAADLSFEPKEGT